MLQFLTYTFSFLELSLSKVYSSLTSHMAPLQLVFSWSLHPKATSLFLEHPQCSEKTLHRRPWSASPWGGNDTDAYGEGKVESRRQGAVPNWLGWAHPSADGWRVGSRGAKAETRPERQAGVRGHWPCRLRLSSSHFVLSQWRWLEAGKWRESICDLLAPVHGGWESDIKRDI